jgi:RNA polymerase sigma-70 factor (ECF subfamily)
MSEEHDDRLQIEAAQRDPSRFADLYEQNFYAVYAYISRRVGDRHQAEDLTADVFREALAGIGKFEWRGVPFIAWLLRIASRAIADHWQRSGRESGNPALNSDRPGSLKSNAAPCCSNSWTGFPKRSSE